MRYVIHRLMAWSRRGDGSQKQRFREAFFLARQRLQSQQPRFVFMVDFYLHAAATRYKAPRPRTLAVF